MNYTNRFHLSCEDRLCFPYSPSVIGAVRSILLALCNGAALCVYDLKVEGFAKLADWLRQERITLFFTVASVFRQFTSMLTGEDQFPDMRLIRLGGETALPKDVESYKKHFSKDCLFVNPLGPTETGFFSWYCMDKETPVIEGSVPVGYPAEGYEILLLNEDGEEAGADQIGEIAVKSRYLAPGYWKRPDLTEASFLPVPGGGEERTYRTGDLGRRLSDGCLIHMGRKDHQVKIRGYRIEVAEIEKVLLDLDAVKDTVVMPWKEKEGENHLVAYFVPAADGSPSVTALRRELSQKLPGYMVPAYFVQLDEFPRAANGKINRGALPPPGSQRPALNIPFSAPRNPTEKKVAQIWCEVLGLEQVGVNDPFLELGGDSLRATQVISRVIDKFHVEISIIVLFDAPTVAEMSAIIARHLAPGGDPDP
jgi:acyl-coenzyme A synthetase/AMP-(fatty) acid ligase/acyl carrier protein